MQITIYQRSEPQKHFTRRLYVRSVTKYSNAPGEYIAEAVYHNGTRDRFILNDAAKADALCKVLEHGRIYFRDDLEVFATHSQTTRESAGIVKTIKVQMILPPGTNTN